MLSVISEVNARMDATASVGYVGGETSWDYPLFGEHRERRVVRLKFAQVNVTVMAIEGVGGVPFAPAEPPPPPLVSHMIGDDY